MAKLDYSITGALDDRNNMATWQSQGGYFGKMDLYSGMISLRVICEPNLERSLGKFKLIPSLICGVW